MGNRPRLLFYFLHLLGVGHVYRAQRLIEGFTEAGIAVDVIYGGERLPDIEFAAESIHFLSPIKAKDSTYSSYLDGDGNPLTRAYQDKRTAELLAVFEKLTPDAILIEAFPFGRRMVRHELCALIDTAKSRSPKPLIISSVRDILQERKKPERLQETLSLIETRFDHVLVHSDPGLIKLSETFAPAPKIENKLTYTGFVVPPPLAEDNIEKYDAIVSAGGGAFGGELMDIAWQAAKQRDDLKWCFSVGSNGKADLEKEVPSHIRVVSHLENLSAHMREARLSISQCGYNTAMDMLAAHRDSACRAVLVPFDTQGQTEQAKRAELLARAGYAINLPQSQLTVERLTKAIEQGLGLPKVESEIDFDGVKNSARIMCDWLSKK